MKRTVKVIAALMLMVLLFSSFQFKVKEHAYVDLGLPSGTLWATCNIGADAPHEFGSYFAWGEVEPKASYDWENYRFQDGKLIKYCCDSKYGSRGYVDGLSVLEPSDDAAAVNWGQGWRIPSVSEANELLKNCKQKWTSRNGVSGISFTGPNGNSIFLPAASFYDGDELDDDEDDDDDDGSFGFYWLNSYRKDMPNKANSLVIIMGLSNLGNNSQRYYGLTIRPVRSK